MKKTTLPPRRSGINVNIPEDQKKALCQAILTLLSVLFGIGLTLASQAVTQIIMPPAETVIVDPSVDPMQTLGSTHLTDLYVDNLDASTALTAQTATVTGTLTAGTASWGCSTATITQNLNLTGTLTAQTATVTGTLTAEQVTSTDDATVTDALTVGGAATISGAATINNNITITGTADLQGNVSDSGGDLTLADNVVITGTADLQGGDLTLENDETISNSTDGIVTIGGFLGLTEGTVVEVTAAGTVTPLGSFQPLTSSAAITNAVIADGTLAGQILIMTNENAGDDIKILESGSNLAAGGDITLAGGQDDGILLIWTGDEWIKVAAFGDN